LLFLTPHYGTVGGVRIIVDALAKAARAGGHELASVVDADARHAPGVAREIRLYPFPPRARELSRLRRFARRFPFTAARLVRAVREFAPDVVSVHCVRRFAPYAAVVRRVTGIPQVLSLQEGMLPPGTPENVGLFRLLVRSVDVVAACSGEAARYAADIGGARRVSLVPNGYDPEEFQAVDPYSHPRPYVLALGRLEIQKGFDVLIEALARLANPAADLLIAGEGAERGELEALARARGIADRVHFLGTTDRRTTVALLRSAAVVCCPSRFEGLPLVAIEAFAAGRPVVATNVNGIPELVRHEETGVVVPPDDPPALAAALARVLAAPGEALSWAARGRADVEARNRWSVVTEQYLALCAEAANVTRTQAAA
jgi:glycosyltransferase involved in cell wall biosynthesis